MANVASKWDTMSKGNRAEMNAFRDGPGASKVSEYGGVHSKDVGHGTWRCWLRA